MKSPKIIIALVAIATNLVSFANDFLERDTVINLEETTVVSLYRNTINNGSLLGPTEIQTENYGQEPSFIFQQMPSIFAYNDAGTTYGYSYFRIRGMSQERMNVTLDGMPWNEAEDFGCYFSNSPDLLSSMHSVKVERGASVTNNGTAAYAGNVSLESVNLKKDTLSFTDIGGGSFNTYRITGVYNMGLKKNWGLHLRGTISTTDGYKKHSYNRSQAFTLKTGYFFNNYHSLEFLSMTGQHRNGQAFIGLTEEQLPTHLNPFSQIENGCAPQETDNFFLTINKLQYSGKLSNKVWLTASVYWNHLVGDYRCLTPELWNYHLNHQLYGGNVVSNFYLGDFKVSGGVNAYMFSRRHIGTILPQDTVVDFCQGYGPELYNNIGYKPDINVFASGTYTKGNFKINGNIQYRYTSLDYKVKIAENPYDKDMFHKWNFLNAGAGIEYQNSFNTFYARWALTHREPSRTDMFGGEYRTEYEFASTQAEKVNDLEIGWDINADRINANLNFFYMKFDNEMVATGELSEQNGLFLHTQKNSYRTGIEWNVNWNIFKTFNFIMSGAWSSNKIFTEDENGHKATKNNTYSPDYIMYGEINYKFPCDLTVGLTTTYKTKMYLDISNENYLPQSFNLSLFVQKEWRQLALSLHMNNLTNRINFSSGSVYDGVTYYQIDAPFNFFVNLRYKF